VPETITPAATVVPLRDGTGGLEVLLLRRNRRGAFGGMWVFPGGQVDEQDLPEVPAGEEVSAARRAAVREAFEEASVRLDPSDLVALSFWLPPREAPRRFATWFFLAAVRSEVQVVVDRTEIHEHRWMSPAAAMDLRQAGDIDLAPPTFTTLWWLSRHRRVDSALASASSRAPERFETRVVPSEDGRPAAMVWAGDAAYDDGDLDRPGRRRRLLVGPGGWEVQMSGGP
jgi:8-oxo-dGTP pyrophosphatase MutT (NUDIX family)